MSARGLSGRYLPGWLLVLPVAFVLAGCSGFDISDLASPFRSDDPRMAGDRRPALADSGQIGEVTGEPATIGAATLNANWPNAGGPATSAPGNSAAGSGQVAYTASIGRGSGRRARISATPVVNQGILVAIDGNGAATALQASSGSRAWSVDLMPDGEDVGIIYGGGLASDGGRVFVNTPFGEAVALDLASGNLLWTADLPEPTRGAPTAAGGRVYIISANNVIYALEQETGAIVWSFDGIPERSGLLANSSPSVSGNRVVVPFTSGEILTFDAETGEGIWSAQLAGQSRFTAVSGFSDVAARPVISDGVVYAISVSGNLIATRLDDGNRLWGNGLASAHTPAVSGDSLFVVTLTGDVAAVDRETGAVRWDLRLTSEERASWVGPLLAGNALWIGSSTGRLVRVDPANGQVISDTEFGNAINIPPIAAGGVVYILDDSGRITALN